jgi:metal-dependent amidase/aminoacylase/carboxypeptidase family protein
MAIKLGVREEWMTFLPTNNGLWIDICGQAPPQQKNVRIALRADIDALQMA